MPRRLLSASHRGFAVAAMCVVLSSCTDNSTAVPEPSTSVPRSIVGDSSDGGSSATLSTAARTFDACAVLPVTVARHALGIAADAPITQTESGERCTWRDDGDPARVLTMTQGGRLDPETFFTDHPTLTDVATSDQQTGGLHIAVEELASGVKITILLSTVTYVLTLPDRPGNVQEFVTEMTGIGA